LARVAKMEELMASKSEVKKSKSSAILEVG